MSWVMAGVAGAQLIAGGIKAGVANSRQKKAEKRKLVAQDKMVKEASRMKNVTQGAGMAQAQAQARQAQADTMGQAQMQTSDPNKLNALASQTNMQSLKAGQARDAITEQQRLQGQQQYVQALGGKAGQEMQLRNQAMQRADAQASEGANLMGAGAQNLVTMQRDTQMLDTYAQIEAGTYDPAAKRGFAWNTLFGGSGNAGDSTGGGGGTSKSRIFGGL